MDHDKPEDDEDVPSDFFDDFMSNDFMDGLDVVDAWDDDNEQKEKESEKPVKSNSRSRKRRISRSRSPVRRRSRDYIRDRSPRRRYRSRSLRDRGILERQRRRSSKSKGSFHEDVLLDNRRDPEKTKRDIQKDKDKCAKDQEEKIISEKLKVVETGLVPPGTEMEVNLEGLTSNSDLKKSDKQKSDSLSGKKLVLDKYVRGKRERSIEYRSSKYSRSPRRHRSRSRSSKFLRRLSTDHKNFTDRRKMSPNHFSKTSLGKEVHRKSPSSDREKWMRNQDRRVTAADFFENQQNLKPDFGNSFGNKFGGVNTNKYYSSIQGSDPAQNYNIVPAPVPAPVSVPEQYFPVSSDGTYDQSFFIGHQFSELYPNPSPYQMPPVYQPPYQNNPAVVDHISNSNVVTVPIVESNPLGNTTIHSKNVDNSELDIKKEKETINKLFEDKQISLSDFLSASANFGDHSKPINVQKKIKVISLCQDAITHLSPNSQLRGRFFLRKIQKQTEKQDCSKYQSPLRKSPFIRFSFTTPTKTADNISPLQKSLNKLLASLGLLEEAVPVLAKPTPPGTPVEISQSPTPGVYSTTPAKWQSLNNVKGGDSVSQLAPRKAKMCQTDPIKCEMCEIRKTRKFVDKEVQCEVSKSSFGTQVTDDDLVRFGFKTQFLNKNQSLAHLTPAQLMRQTLNQPETNQANNYMTRGLSEAIENPNQYRDDNNSVPDFTRFGKPSSNFNTSSFKNRNNNQFEPSSSFVSNRQNVFGNRNFNTPVWDNTHKRAHDTFDGARQNYGSNVNTAHSMQQQPNKRTLLPNPTFKRHF